MTGLNPSAAGRLQQTSVMLLGAARVTRRTNRSVLRFIGQESRRLLSLPSDGVRGDGGGVGCPKPTKLEPACNVAYLGLGSNQGDRHANLLAALKALGRVGDDSSGGVVTVEDTSRLYESAPLYVEDQPRFLNAVCKVTTNLEPNVLLVEAKRVEEALGRQPGVRYGPRPIDIDLVLFGRIRGDDDGSGGHGVSWVKGTWREVRGCGHDGRGVVVGDLTLPHPRLAERAFVLRPLLDLLDPKTPLPHGAINSITTNKTTNTGTAEETETLAAAPPRPPPATTLGACLAALSPFPSADSCFPVLPLGGWLAPLVAAANVKPDNDAATTVASDSDSSSTDSSVGVRRRSYFWRPVLVMGILNVTPDSFSDGGVDGLDADAAKALCRGLALARGGARVVDVGGESTRPGAAEVDATTQLARVVPVIAALRRALDDAAGYDADAGRLRDVIISVDTRSAVVARAAVAAGAGMVNDVSGGRHDPTMLRAVAELGVPFVCTHSRGDPQTMRSLASYRDVVGEVGAELAASLVACRRAGIPRWLLIADPGLGFAKEGVEPNLALLGPRNLHRLSALVGGAPLLVGPSRKRFLASFGVRSLLADEDEREARGEGASITEAARAVVASTEIIREDVGERQRATPLIADARLLKPTERDAGSAACACACAVANWHSSVCSSEQSSCGGNAVVVFVRVHDVPGVVRSLATMEAVLSHDG